MKIYFAGSIRGGRDDALLYNELIEKLQNFGDVLTEHLGLASLSSFGEIQKTDQQIYGRDIEWLKEADVVVAEVTTASLGVGYEIAKAEEWGKRILCLYRPSEGKRLSAMLTGGSLTVKEYQTALDLETIFNEFFA